VTMRTILFLVWKEYLHVFRDRATTFQVLGIPFVQLLVLASAATFTLRDTPVHLVDLDRTGTSRQLAQRFEASPQFRLTGASGSIVRAADALLAREARLVLHIPEGFERDLVRFRAAPVQLVIDAEQGSTAGVLRGYASAILLDYAAELGTTSTPAFQAAAGTAVVTPLDLRTRAWYNPSLDYKDYMVPGILVALVTLIGTLLTAQNVAREKELGTLEQLNVSPLTRTQFIAGKLIPFWILAMAELAIGLALAAFVFRIPMRGSLLLVFAVAAVYLVAALGLGLLISTVAETQQQAMFVTFFVMMVYLLMSGLFTPLISMPQWAQWLAELNPVKHFVLVMRAVLVKGAGPADLLAPIAALAAFATTFLLLAIRQHSKRTG
jgi:ABC-2 type transport system permease protein